MLRFSCVVVGLLLVASSATAGELKLDVRRRVEDAEKRGTFKTVESQQTVDAARTAIVIVDMWDDHHCKSAAARVGEMAPHMNKTIAAARKRGVLIVHAPSGCMDFYKETPQRKRAQQAKLARSGVKFQWNYFNSKHEGPLADKLEKAGCSCDSPEPCGPSYRAWKRQTAGLEIAAEDAVSDNGQEIFNLLGERKIDNVILMGVHTNRCVLGRPFGIRQMSYLGKKVYLCRDLTDSYHRDPGKHFEGLHAIVAHVETYWCPTVTSESLLGEGAFRFEADATRESTR